MVSEQLRVGRRSVPITHADRVVFPEADLTNLDLARHYERVAERMLPHLRGRPLALEAYPDGVASAGYLMKAVPGHFPPWIRRATVPKRGGTVTHVIAHEAATLVYFASQNVITLHTWLSRVDEPQRPDRVVLDLDPSGGGFAPYAMITGSRGVHVVCPLRRGPSFSDVHRFARSVAEAMVADDPRHLTLEWRKRDRGSRIYVDVNRNAYAQHAVAPYAVRQHRSRCRCTGRSCRIARSDRIAGPSRASVRDWRAPTRGPASTVTPARSRAASRPPRAET